jgi:hypothetical protein
MARGAIILNVPLLFLILDQSRAMSETDRPENYLKSVLIEKTSTLVLSILLSAFVKHGVNRAADPHEIYPIMEVVPAYRRGSIDL